MKLILILAGKNRKPARKHWKADTSKTRHCLVLILVQRHNWEIFLWKWARRGRYSQCRSLSGHIARIFVHKNLKGGYWQHLVSTEQRYMPYSRSYTRCFEPCFWRPHSSCDLTALDSYLWGAIEDKCYADKPETIDALKDNNREIIGEIQLHTIDNVLKNSTDHVGYCMASRVSHLNEIIFHY